MEIHIQVSNIAALIGKHKYRTQKEGIDILASNIYNNKHLKFKTNDSDLIKIKNKLTNDLVKSKNFDKKSPVALNIKSFQASAIINPAAAAKANLSCFLNSLLK